MGPRGVRALRPAPSQRPDHPALDPARPRTTRALLSHFDYMVAVAKGMEPAATRSNLGRLWPKRHARAASARCGDGVVGRGERAALFLLWRAAAPGRARGSYGNPSRPGGTRRHARTSGRPPGVRDVPVGRANTAQS